MSKNLLTMPVVKNQKFSSKKKYPLLNFFLTCLSLLFIGIGKIFFIIFKIISGVAGAFKVIGGLFTGIAVVITIKK